MPPFISCAPLKLNQATDRIPLALPSVLSVDVCAGVSSCLIHVTPILPLHLKGKATWKQPQESEQPNAVLLFFGRVKRYMQLGEKGCWMNEKVGHEKVESGWYRRERGQGKSYSSTATVNRGCGRHLSERTGENVNRMSGTLRSRAAGGNWRERGASSRTEEPTDSWRWWWMGT